MAGGTVSPPQVLQNWQNIIGNASTIDTGFIVLEHDLFPQTVDLATGYILPAALANNPKLQDSQLFAGLATAIVVSGLIGGVVAFLFGSSKSSGEAREQVGQALAKIPDKA